MQLKKNDKRDFLKKILHGEDLDSIINRRKEEIKECSGIIIWIEEQENKIWKVRVPLFGWVQNKYKEMTKAQLDKFIEIYDFQAWDMTFENGKVRGKIINAPPLNNDYFEDFQKKKKR